jgi:hypothetical protein
MKEEKKTLMSSGGNDQPQSHFGQPLGRRTFLKTSMLAGSALLVPSFISCQEKVGQTLPWQREVPLKKAARSVFIEGKLDPKNPFPRFNAEGTTPAMTIDNLKMRTTIWGPSDRVTISLTRNNIWDRRLHEFEVPKLQDIIDGAYSPVNKDYIGIRENITTRPKDLGWLTKKGGSYDPYRNPMRYAFPSLKPAGQIILGMDALAGAESPVVKQSCSNGLVTLTVAKDGASANLEYILGMTSNIYAIRANFSGMNAPVWLRVFRHRDTSHMTYMNMEGTKYTNPDAVADKAFNGPVDAPTSGTDGKFFWIRQRMPAEKTFPQGFEYVLMGIVATPGEISLDSKEGEKGLGTPPPSPPLNGEWKNGPRPVIGDVPGAAATATLKSQDGKKLEAFVTIVTCMDGDDIMGIARKKLNEAVKGGFDGVVQENTKWHDDFYDLRENGRIFTGSGTEASDNIRNIYQSYADSHGGGTKTDMRQYECSASYALPERDFQEWDSAPCYNEIFYTERFVRNWGDSEDMWKQIVEHWTPGAQQNARDMFGMPGMLLVHGYLPPVKPDKYVHTTITLEFCLGTMAQIIRPAWDEWDYGGDINFLKETCYPMMKQMALFYAAYAKKGDGGYYHIIPSMEEERWGFYPEFSKNKDVISSLCMFRWALERTATAADILGVDADLSKQWREVARNLAPYPTWDTPDGKIFSAIPGVEPVHLSPDHPFEANSYPAILADEINLDSPKEQIEMMVRTVKTPWTGKTGETLNLLGIREDPPAGNRRRAVGMNGESLLNSRSGRIHLFPSVKPEETELAFRNFQSRGAFVVSACKNTKGVYFLEIMSRNGNRCLLMNPWPGKKVVVKDTKKWGEVKVEVDTQNGECLVFNTEAGHTYLISQA